MYTWVPASNAEGDDRSHPEQSKWQRPPRRAIHAIKGIAPLETAKSHVFLLMQISYPYIVWNNIPQVSEKLWEQFQKTEKITRTIPILTSNSTLFSFNFFFYDGYWNFYKWGGGGRPGVSGIYFFDILLYNFINVIKKTHISSFIVICVTYFTHS